MGHYGPFVCVPWLKEGWRPARLGDPAGITAILLRRLIQAAEVHIVFDSPVDACPGHSGIAMNIAASAGAIGSGAAKSTGNSDQERFTDAGPSISTYSTAIVCHPAKRRVELDCARTGAPSLVYDDSVDRDTEAVVLIAGKAVCAVLLEREHPCPSAGVVVRSPVFKRAAVSQSSESGASSVRQSVAGRKSLILEVDAAVLLVGSSGTRFFNHGNSDGGRIGRDPSVMLYVKLSLPR